MKWKKLEGKNGGDTKRVIVQRMAKLLTTNYIPLWEQLSVPMKRQFYSTN